MTGPPDIGEVIARQPWRSSGRLSLRGLGLKALPELPAGAAELRSLDLSRNRLRELPGWLWELRCLERLDLATNRLSMLDAGVARLPGLRELDVSENRLTKLPAELAECTSLRVVELYGNRLEDLGPIARLPALALLDAAGNRLRTVESLAGRDTLVSLDLGGNLIASLSPSFSELRSLRRLDLSGNLLTSGSVAVLAGLPLEELYLDDNRLEEPPVALASLPGMRRFSALGNPFGQLPSAAHPVGEEAAAAVESRISGEPQEGRRYFDAPTYRFDFSLAVGGVAATRQVVDLYYKRFHGVPATVHLKDGTRLPLGGLSRRRAIDLVERRQRGGGTAHVDIGETKDSAVRAGAAAFVSQAVARVDRAQLVSPASRASAVVFVQPPLPRVLNVAVASSDRRVLGGSETLRPASEYLVRVDIGVRSEESVLVDPVPFRAEELEPSSAEGWWFDVVVSSGELDVQGDLHRLFLPFDGPSWACGCAGQEHVCAAEQRRPHLYVPVKTRGTGAGTLRCTVYDRNNAVQSARLEVVVADGSSRDGAIRGIVDFSLSDDVSRSEGFAPRRVNVLTNAAAGGTHTIVVKDDSRAIVVDLTETSTVEILRGLRGQLVRITLGADGRTSQYDADNAKAAGHYIEDLESLAHLGAAFWQKVVPRGDDQERLRGLLARRATIQIARATSVVFPWALVYDIPHLLADPWKPCPLLADWETERAALESYPDACPYEREHRLNILCPYGFWGFKHLIEQPPTVSRGLLRTRIPVARGARAAVIRSLDLDSDLTEAHLTDLRVCFADRFELTDCDSRDDLLEAIRKPVLPIVYFYCHGRIAVLADTSLEAPYLEIGSREILGAGDLGAWAAAGEWNRQNWVEAPPLVFINGCRTAALSPEDVVSFAEAFSGMDAAGVVGTEIPVAQPVASEIARRFYAYFTGTQPLPVGAALQRARLDLLAKGNVSGLAYTPFCSMDLELEEVRAA